MKQKSKRERQQLKQNKRSKEINSKDLAHNVCNNHLVCINSGYVKNYCNILYFLKFTLVALGMLSYFENFSIHY